MKLVYAEFFLGIWQSVSWYVLNKMEKSEKIDRTDH